VSLAYAIVAPISSQPTWLTSISGQFPLPAPLQDIAIHLLIRGDYAYLGYGWLGCISEYERPTALMYDFGVPRESICYEISPGVFKREYTKSSVVLDCNSFTPNITLRGQNHTIPIPPPPQPPPLPPGEACTGAPIGYTCQLHRCSTDGDPRGHCGPDLCFPKIQVPSLCTPLPFPMSDAVAEAARRCTSYQQCRSFGIYSGALRSKSTYESHCFKNPSACFKFFTTGNRSLDAVPDSWIMYLKK